MAKGTIFVLALCAQLVSVIASCSDGEKNWRQCVYKNLNDNKDTGLIKVWISTFPKTKLCKQL
mgnify:FL=1